MGLEKGEAEMMLRLLVLTMLIMTLPSMQALGADKPPYAEALEAVQIPPESVEARSAMAKDEVVPQVWATTIEWIEAHPGLAAWVQGLGTLLAVMVAILVPYRLSKSERDRRSVDRKLEAQGLAVLVHAPLLVLEGQIERDIQSALSINGLIVRPPDIIVDNIQRLWVMGRAGGLILQMISGLNANERLIWSTLEANPTFEEAKVAYDLSVERLKLLQGVLSDARKEISLLLELPDK